MLFRSLYVHEAVKRKPQTGFNSAAATSSEEDAKPRSPAGAIKSFMEKLRSVNPDSVSKVVDENGEPLVVYHGTPDPGFTEFVPETITNPEEEYGFFFSTSKAVASNPEYTDEGRGRVIAAFLKVANPYEVDIQDWNYARGLSPSEAKAAGHDGYIILRQENATTWAVFEPSSVKSAETEGALANAGTYSADTGDLRRAAPAPQSDAVQTALASMPPI